MGKGPGRPRKFGKKSEERKKNNLTRRQHKTRGKRLANLKVRPNQRRPLLRDGAYLGVHLQEKSPMELMKIPGIGPETAKKLYRSIGIEYSTKELKKYYRKARKRKSRERKGK